MQGWEKEKESGVNGNHKAEKRNDKYGTEVHVLKNEVDVANKNII